MLEDGPLTPLRGDDSDVVPVFPFPVQFHGCGDEAGVRGDAEQSLRVRLGINGEPINEKNEVAGGDRRKVKEARKREKRRIKGGARSEGGGRQSERSGRGERVRQR